MSQPEPMTLVFKFHKETKNTRRYEEQTGESGMPPKIGTLYVQKWAISDNPEFLTVHIVKGKAKS